MDDQTLRRLQLVQLDMLNEIRRVCDANGITYYLACGTLIGALRHKAFIPWDDDLDVSMPREDYEKFCRVAPEQLDSRYFLQTWESDPHYGLPYGKLLKNGTRCSEAVTRGTGVREGIFVDIFPIYHCGSREEMETAMRPYLFWTKLLLMKQRYKVWDASFALNAKSRYLVLRGLSAIFPRRLIIGQVKKVLDSWEKRYADSPYVFENYGYSFTKWIIRRENYAGGPVMVEFEGDTYKAPHDADGVMRDMYGDYMQLPPENERYNRHKVMDLQF